VQDDFTISFWFKPENAGRSAPNDGFPRDRSVQEKWWVYYTALIDAEVPMDVNDFGITWGNSAVHFGIGNPAMSIHVKDVAVGKWHHVAATRVKSTGRVELYVDGVLGSSGNGPKQSLTDATYITAGRIQSGAAEWKDSYFKGWMADL